MLFVLAIGAVAAMISVSERPGLMAIVLVMCVSVLTPIWLQWRKGTLDLYEPIHILGLLNTIYFGFGAIWAMNDPIKVAYDSHLPPYIPGASFLCMLGMLAMQIGYWGFWRRRVKTRGTVWMPVNSLFLTIPASLGFLGHVAEAAVERGSSLPLVGGLTSAVSQFAPLYSFAWALGFLLLLSGTCSRQIKTIVLFGMVPATGLVIAMLLNNKSLLLVLAGTPLVALWYTKRKVPWVPLTALLLILVFIVFPFNNLIRNIDAEIPFMTRVEMTLNRISKWNSDKYMDRSVGNFTERLAMVNSVAVVRRDVGRWVPYAKGETIFLPTVIYFIPRALWPGKPVHSFGRDFGIRFRVVNILDKETWIAPTVPGELYWNFGGLGIVFGMGLWGLGIRLLYRRYGESYDLDPVNRAIQVLILIQLVHFGGGIALDIDNVLRTLLMLEAYRLFAIRFGFLQRETAVPMKLGRAAGAAA